MCNYILATYMYVKGACHSDHHCYIICGCGFLLVALQYGNQDVQLSAAEQLVDRSQTRAVADAMKWLQARLKQQHPQQQQGGKTLRQWLEDLEAAFDQQVCLCYRIQAHEQGQGGNVLGCALSVRVLWRRGPTEHWRQLQCIPLLDSMSASAGRPALVDCRFVGSGCWRRPVETCMQTALRSLCSRLAVSD